MIWQHIFFIRKTGLTYAQHLTGLSLPMNDLRSVSVKPNIYDYNTGFGHSPVEETTSFRYYEEMPAAEMQNHQSTTINDTSKKQCLE